MALGGVVYDVTDYVGKHPGGIIILEGAGKDGTQLFSNFYFLFLDKYHPWVNGSVILRGKEVGTLDMRTRVGGTPNLLSV